MKKITLIFLIVLSSFNLSRAQVATINVTNLNTTVMDNTSLLFGITFDARTSMTGNPGVGQIGYYNANGTIIPEVDTLFNDFPMSTLRYPGNGIGVGFDWKKSIGTVGSRPNQNLLGTQGQPQPVNFGFDEFMNMVESKGVSTSEVQIMVPIYDISTPGLTNTQSLAAIANVISNNADWVEYCNAPNDSSNPGGGIDWAAQRAANGHPLPYNVKIWNIGNEPWSPSEFGLDSAGCHAYLAMVTSLIDSMLAIDSTIKITCPTTGNPTNPASWSNALLNSNLVNQGKVYALSQHYFPTEKTIGANPPAQGVSAVSNALNPVVTIAATKNVKVFIGDYAHNIAGNPSAAQEDSAMQWLGANLETDFLLMISQMSSIERVNFWTYGNAQAVWHPIRYNSPGNYTLMPGAMIYKILFPAFLDKSIAVNTSSPVASDGNPYSVRSNCFVSNDLSKLNIIAVNRDKMNAVPLQVSGTTGYAIANSRILTADSLSSETIVESTILPDSAGNYLMPPMSVLILEHVNATTGLNSTREITSTVCTYPNPAMDILNFQEPLENISIINSFGQMVYQNKGRVNKVSISNLKEGVYFIKSDSVVCKFVVKRH